MTPGSGYPVSITLRNTGDTTWTAAGAYRLGTQNPSDNAAWGMHRVSLPSPIAPGQEVTFTFNVTAPAAGAYHFQWRMVQEGVQWFGDLTPDFTVQVGTNSAVLVSQTVSSHMTPGGVYPVSVTFRNSRDTTWTAGGAYRLGSQNPPDNVTWGLRRVALPGSVSPGQQVTFTFNVTAPGAPGTYHFQWRMVQDGVQWFGDLTPDVPVDVSP